MKKFTILFVSVLIVWTLIKLNSVKRNPVTTAEATPASICDTTTSPDFLNKWDKESMAKADKYWAERPHVKSPFGTGRSTNPGDVIYCTRFKGADDAIGQVIEIILSKPKYGWDNHPERRPGEIWLTNVDTGWKSGSDILNLKQYSTGRTGNFAFDRAGHIIKSKNTVPFFVKEAEWEKLHERN